jgi:hypothetical protein
MRVTGFEPVGREFERGVVAQTAKGWPEGVRNLATPNYESISRDRSSYSDPFDLRH